MPQITCLPLGLFYSSNPIDVILHQCVEKADHALFVVDPGYDSGLPNNCKAIREAWGDSFPSTHYVQSWVKGYQETALELIGQHKDSSWVVFINTTYPEVARFKALLESLNSNQDEDKELKEVE